MVFAQDRERWGFKRAAYMMLMRFMKSVFGFHAAVVYKRSLSAETINVAIPDGYEIRELSESDYDLLPQNPRLSTTAEFIEDARKHGGFCGAAFHDGEIVSSVWRAFRDAPAHDGFRIRMTPELRYGYKALTLAEHRGKHLLSAISFISDRTCIERGCKYGASYVETHNYSSRASDDRRGGIVVGYIAWMDKGPIRWCYNSPGAKRFGMVIYDPQRRAA